ncbi:MAG TPA: SsrA-binding protein SmpB [Bacteroidia bacterium]|jgi:SsrA-binding protein|nr:SsrA-binding protein SmpB [Bacteroidia bacterium]
MYFWGMSVSATNINIQNRRATFDYSFSDKFIAGMVLKGTEIKSIRDGKVSLADSYCFIKNGELFIRNLHITEYEKASFYNHAPMRERKLLLNKIELNKIERKLKDAGTSIIALRLFIGEKGYAKLEIGIGKGKKSFDKREDIKKRDIERETARKF